MNKANIYLCVILMLSCNTALASSEEGCTTFCSQIAALKYYGIQNKCNGNTKKQNNKMIHEYAKRGKYTLSEDVIQMTLADAEADVTKKDRSLCNSSSKDYYMNFMDDCVTGCVSNSTKK